MFSTLLALNNEDLFTDRIFLVFYTTQTEYL